MKRLAVVISLGVFLFAGVTIGQNWEFEEIFIDFELPQDDGYGIHGVAVAPDGNIWLALHGGLTSDTLIVDADTGFYRPVYILDPTTGEHVSFSPLKVIELPGGILDTLWTGSPHNGSGKGISVDRDGNILYSSWSTVYRINYQTGEGMNRFIPTDMSSLTEAVQDANGLIYVGYVISAARPVFILDDDFTLVGNAIDTLGYINRTLAVTPDGKDFYTGSTWNGFGIAHYHSEIPGVLPHTVVDTFGNWDSVYIPVGDTSYLGIDDTTYYDVKLWASCLDWGPDGLLWAGNLRPDWSGPKGGRYYAYDVTTHEIVDSVGIPVIVDTGGAPIWGDPYAGGLFSPRGADWSADGNTMYLADFDYNTVGVWKREIGIEEDTHDIPLAFKLSQNYPNPFNSTTTISFALLKNGFVELRVYDIVGREVATLIRKSMDMGQYRVPFNASGLASGVYFYRMAFDGQLLTKRMLLLK